MTGLEQVRAAFFLSGSTKRETTVCERERGASNSGAEQENCRPTLSFHTASKVLELSIRLSSSAIAISSDPWPRRAAQWNAVSPCASRRPASAPCWSSSTQTSLWPARAASRSEVTPLGTESIASTAAPASRRKRAVGTSPSLYEPTRRSALVQALPTLELVGEEETAHHAAQWSSDRPPSLTSRLRRRSSFCAPSATKKQRKTSRFRAFTASQTEPPKLRTARRASPRARTRSSASAISVGLADSSACSDRGWWPE